MATIVNARDVLLQAAVPRLYNVEMFPQINGFKNSSFRKNRIWDPSPSLTSYAESWLNYTPNPTVNRLSLSTGGESSPTPDYLLLPDITSADAAYSAFGQDPEEGWKSHTYYVLSFETRAYFAPPGVQFTLAWGASGATYTSPVIIKTENPVITNTEWRTFVCYFKFDQIVTTGAYVVPHLRITLATTGSSQYVMIRKAMLQKGMFKIDYMPALNEIQGKTVESFHMVDEAVNETLTATSDGAGLNFDSGTYTTVATFTHDAAQSCMLICSVSGALVTTQPASPGTVLVDNPAWYFEVNGVAGNIVTVPGNNATLPYDVTIAGNDSFAVVPGGTTTILLKMKAQSNKYRAWTENLKVLVEVRKR